MEFEINVVSIPNAITADTAKEFVRQYDEVEMKVDVNTILECIRTKPWPEISLKAKQGKTSYSLTIGFDKGNICTVRQKYGWAWLQKNGEQFITNLFTSLGYKVQIERFARYRHFIISWAE